MKQLKSLTNGPIWIIALLVIFSLVLEACAPTAAAAPPAATAPAIAATSTSIPYGAYGAPAAPAAPATVNPTVAPATPAAGGAQTGNEPAPVTSPTPAASPPAPTAVPTGTSVQAADNPNFGQILVAANGMSLYTFEADQNGKSACISAACVSFWPPYTLSAPPTAEAGLVGTLGTITRPDGSLQVTYNGMPLYTFAVDKNPGDVKGDAINEFGGIWHVAKISSAAAAGKNVATQSGKKNNKKKRNNPPPMYNYNY